MARKKCHDGIIRRLVLDSQFLYSASEDNTLKIWNKEHLSLVEMLEHHNFVQDIALIKESIITVSYNGEITKKKKTISKISV